MPMQSFGSVKVFWPPWTRTELIQLLRSRMPDLAAALPVREVTLFGSWAKGRATARSDVDLLVIYDDPPRPDAFAIVSRVVDVRGLEPHVYAASEAASVGDVLARMQRGGVRLI